MSIDAIAGISASGGLSSVAGLGGLGGVTGAAGTAAPSAAAGTDALFGASLTGSIDQLQAMQSRSDALAVQAVTGDLDDIHDYTIASSQAAVTLELTAALRNKAVEAFTEIMRMQA